MRKPGLAYADEIWRRVYASHMETFLDEVAGNRLTRAAPDIQNGSPGSQLSQEFVETGFFKKVAATHAVPILSMPVIQADDSFSISHSKTLTCVRKKTNRAPGSQYF